MRSIDRACYGFGLALVLALVLLPLHLFVAPHVHLVLVLCWLGWLWVGVFVIVATKNLHHAWWKHSVLRDFALQHGREATLQRFVLLLRTSRSDRELPQQRELRSIEYSAGAHVEVQRVLPGTVQQLEQALLPLPLKRIKHPAHADDVPTVQYDDETWRREIVHDFRLAEAILVLPLWLNETVQWEIRTVLSMGLGHKLFFVMPAQLDAPEGVSTAWYSCKQQLRELGIELKGYLPCGAVLGQQQPLRFTRVLPMNALSAEQLSC